MKCEHEWRHYHYHRHINFEGKKYDKIYFYCKKCLNNKITLVKL